MIGLEEPAPEDGAFSALGSERRHVERMQDSPGWTGHRVATPEEVEQLKTMLVFDARQMAELRQRNEQLMVVNSDLRWKLGEMTLRWVDSAYRR